MTISVRFVWGSEGVPFTFSPEQDSCKRKWGTGDTIGMIRKLKYFLGMNKKGILEKRRARVNCLDDLQRSFCVGE